MTTPPPNLPVEETGAAVEPHIQLLTVREVADQLRVSADTIYRLIDAKQMPCHRIGGCKRIARADLVAFLERVRRGPGNQH